MNGDGRRRLLSKGEGEKRRHGAVVANYKLLFLLILAGAWAGCICRRNGGDAADCLPKKTKKHAWGLRAAAIHCYSPNALFRLARRLRWRYGGCMLEPESREMETAQRERKCQIIELSWFSGEGEKRRHGAVVANYKLLFLLHSSEPRRRDCEENGVTRDCSQEDEETTLWGPWRCGCILLLFTYALVSRMRRRRWRYGGRMLESEPAEMETGSGRERSRHSLSRLVVS
ncbi:hypothetical protein HAX54_037758 [Datura stramonium]|uniref:Uncharacterized protein n=1 Tax=Datura stramonium TaxID=4076 RepID=A0ABS8RMN5_DATST|nr:hypothetical protein [Datura stramonium]